MALDTSIYRPLIADRKSVADYDAIEQGRQANALALQGKRMNMLAAQREMEAADAARAEGQVIRNALSGARDEQSAVKALRSTGLPSAYKMADELLKSLDERRKTDADVGYKKAQTGKTQGDAADNALKRYRAALDLVDTPDMAKQWLAAQYQDPETAPFMQRMGPLDQAVQRIPTDPQQFQTWRQRSAMGMENFIRAQETERNNRAQTDTQVRGQDLSAATQRRGQDISASTQIRGQNLTDARAKELGSIQRDAARTQVVETPEGVMLVDKGTGAARPAMTADGKPLPGKPSEAVKKELMSINQQRAVVDGAIKATQATPSAFSLVRGAATMTGPIAESVAGRFDSDAERQARAFVFNNVSKVINERAGAAQSAQELARLRGFLPAETDNAEQVVSKLKAFNAYLDEMERGTTGKPPADQPALPNNTGRTFKVLGKEQ